MMDSVQVSVHPGCAQGQGQGQKYVIRALSWILGMSYCVIDGLVIIVRDTVIRAPVPLYHVPDHVNDVMLHFAR